MRAYLPTSLLTLFAAVFATGGFAFAACPHCQSGDCCDKDEVEYRCVMKVEKKPIKKVVYECKQVPFCVHKVPRLGECGCCAECEACPRFKTVLIKKEIVVGEKCETKCVVEEVKKTPCKHCQANAGSISDGVAGFEAPLPVDVAPVGR